MDTPFNHRQMFERYLYDYFIKQGLHETAEIFRRETGTRIDPLAPPEIDVPDGFLSEWWLINSDHFSEWERKNSQDDEGSLYGDEGNMGQQSVPTTSRERELNEQMIEELTLDNSFGVILGGNLLPETVPNYGSLMSSSTPVNQDGTDNQRREAVIQGYQRTTIVPDEAGLYVPNPGSLMSSSATANQDCTHNQELGSLFQVLPRAATNASNEAGVAVTNTGRLLSSSPPVNQGGTDNQGLESVVEAFIRSTRIASNESGGKRKRSRDPEDESTDLTGANNSHLETSSPFRDLEHLFELPYFCGKVEEDGKGASFSQHNKFDLSTYLVQEKKHEGNFSSKGKTFKRPSSLMEEREEDIGASSIKGDTFGLSSLVEGKKNEERDCSSRDAYMYDSSSHDKGNEDDGVISAIKLDELHEAPKNDESQGVRVGGSLVPETMPHPDSLTWSLSPANLDDTDTLAQDPVVQAIVRTAEISSTENEGKRKKLVDSEGGSIYMAGANNSHLKTFFTVPVDLERIFEVPFSCVKHEGDEQGASSSKDDKISLSTSLVEEKKYEEGKFSHKDETFELASSLIDEKKDDKGASTIKHDTVELLPSLVEGKKCKWDSSGRDAYMHDSSSHDKGNEGDGVIYLSNVDERYESPKNNESQGVIIASDLASETVPNAESFMMFSPPDNLDGTDTQGLDLLAQTVLSTVQITANESGWKRKCLGDPEDGSIDMPGANNSSSRTSPVPMDSDALSELSCRFAKVEEDGQGALSSNNKKFNLSASLVEENKQVEGAFSGKDEMFRLNSSLLEEKKDDAGASSTKSDMFELVSSPVDGKEEKEEDSAIRNTYLYGAHVKGNEDDGVISSSILDQHNESPI